MKIEELLREFHSDPSPESARHLVFVLGRLNLKRPETFKEIRDFCEKNKYKIECYLSAMNYGDPSWSAYKMAGHYGSDRKWAEKIIENDKTGDPSYAAYRMAQFCGSDRKWAEKVIENSNSGHPYLAADFMAIRLFSDRKWANEIKEKWKNKRKVNCGN